jgi:hypothetical protein
MDMVGEEHEATASGLPATLQGLDTAPADRGGANLGSVSSSSSLTRPWGAAQPSSSGSGNGGREPWAQANPAAGLPNYAYSIPTTTEHGAEAVVPERSHISHEVDTAGGTPCYGQHFAVVLFSTQPTITLQELPRQQHGPIQSPLRSIVFGMQTLQEWQQQQERSWPGETQQSGGQQQTLASHSSYSTDPYDAGIVTISQGPSSNSSGAQPSSPLTLPLCHMQLAGHRPSCCQNPGPDVRWILQRLPPLHALHACNRLSTAACGYAGALCAVQLKCCMHARAGGAGFAQAALANGSWARQQTAEASGQSPSSSSSKPLPPPLPLEPDASTVSVLDKESAGRSEQAASAAGSEAGAGAEDEGNRKGGGSKVRGILRKMNPLGKRSDKRAAAEGEHFADLVPELAARAGGHD